MQAHGYGCGTAREPPIRQTMGARFDRIAHCKACRHIRLVAAHPMTVGGGIRNFETRAAVIEAPGLNRR
jgi:phosphoribosylformimino-5-aminoimidazole carboxamide ribonucleotide (ProFAR) isomerase